MTKKFRHAIIGGTFDRFHIGHIALLDKAFAVAEEVSIGISQPELYQHKTNSQNIQDYTIREKSVKDYLKTKNRESRSQFIPITDIYGTTLTDGTIEAIIVSPDTQQNAKKINETRAEKGLLEMEIVTVPFVLAQDGQPISSERIRSGEIDSLGLSYLQFFQSQSDYVLPDSLRDELKQPFGKVVTTLQALKKIISQDSLIITVGDIVSSTLLNSELRPHIAIIDLQTRRHDLEKDIAERLSQYPISLTNPAGTINKDFAPLFLERLQHPSHNPVLLNSDQPVILDLIEDPVIIDSRVPTRDYLLRGARGNDEGLKGQTSIIRVEGEEDLLALPAILLAPLNAVVIYGQADLGMIVVEVTEDKKQSIKTLLEQFSS